MWRDANADGLRGGGEVVQANRIVRLVDLNRAMIAQVVTDAVGRYQFQNLAFATYFIQFERPAGETFSPEDAGSDDSIDSDVDPATGESAPITLTPQALINLLVGAGLTLTVAPPGVTPTVGTGTGLRGQYYAKPDLIGPNIVRPDATVDFNWAEGTPIQGVQADNFSVRWAGQVQPKYTGDWTFTTFTDDGVRLWVNGELVIDQWNIHAGRFDRSRAIPLVGGQKYDIQMEYFENTEKATARLLWSHANQPEEVIPTTQLYPDVTRVVPAGGGLAATYYWKAAPNGASMKLSDTAVNFDWGAGSPDQLIPSDEFSARYVGYVQPRYTGRYTFYTLSDDGVMLWVDGKRLVNHWDVHAPAEDRGMIDLDLVAGEKYSIVMQYYENTERAVVKLMWSSADQAKEVIPATRLYSTTPTMTELVAKGGTLITLPTTPQLIPTVFGPPSKATSLNGVPFWRKDNSPILQLPGEVKPSSVLGGTGWAGVIPPGAFIGPWGTGPCVGVALIPPNVGMPTYIMHFSADSDVSEGFTAVGFVTVTEGLFITRATIPPGYEAVLCGSEASSDATGNQTRLFTLRDVVSFLRGWSIPITAYVPAPAFAVDENGRVYWSAPPGSPTEGFEN